MTDYCLKCVDQAECDAALLAAGLIDEDGLPVSSEVLIDRIGSITKVTGVDANGDPVFITYPEYYVNLRLLFEASEEVATALLPLLIDPSTPQYRVWA